MFIPKATLRGALALAGALLVLSLAFEWEAMLAAEQIPGKCTKENCASSACTDSFACHAGVNGAECTVTEPGGTTKPDTMTEGSESALCSSESATCNAIETNQTPQYGKCTTKYACNCTLSGTEYLCKKKGSAIESTERRKCVENTLPDDPGGGL